MGTDNEEATHSFVEINEVQSCGQQYDGEEYITAVESMKSSRCMAETPLAFKTSRSRKLRSPLR